MSMIRFWQPFKIITFSLFGSLIGLIILCEPDINSTVILVAIIFGFGISLAYFVGGKVNKTQHKARIVEQSLYGQCYFAVEIDGVLLPQLTWILKTPETIAEVRDIIPFDKKLLVRINLYIGSKLLRVHTINCGLPPYIHDDVSI